MTNFNVTDNRKEPFAKVGDILKIAGNYYMINRCFMGGSKYINLTSLSDGSSWTDLEIETSMDYFLKEVFADESEIGDEY